MADRFYQVCECGSFQVDFQAQPDLDEPGVTVVLYACRACGDEWDDEFYEDAWYSSGSA